MQRRLAAEDAEFEAEVDGFIRQHWPQPEIVTAAHLEQWRAALLTRGWSVPGWPVALGGQGWTQLQEFIWFKACRSAGVPGMWDVGIQVVGPALFADDGRFAQARLAEIAQLDVIWCLAERDLEVSRAEQLDNGWQLSGVKGGVEYGNVADWMFASASTSASMEDDKQAWFCVPMSATGLTRGEPHTMDQNVCRRLELRNVVVAQDQCLGQAGISRPELDGVSGLLNRYLQALRVSLADSAAAAAVEIELEALRTMEMRWLDAHRRGVEAPFPASLIRLKGEEIFTQLGDLLIDSFGYDALPDVEAARSHNEAPLGPDGFSQFGGIRRVIGQIMVHSGQSDMLARDQIAEELNRKPEKPR